MQDSSSEATHLTWTALWGVSPGSQNTNLQSAPDGANDWMGPKTGCGQRLDRANNYRKVVQIHKMITTEPEQ